MADQLSNKSSPRSSSPGSPVKENLLKKYNIKQDKDMTYKSES